MALARIYTALNSLIIRKLGDTGGPSPSRVDDELNNIASAFVSVANSVHSSVPAITAGVGTVTSTIATIAGNTLGANGDWIEIQIFGRFLSTANNKEIRLNLNQGGTNIVVTTGVFTVGAPALWEVRVLVRRDNGTTLDARGCGVKASALYGQAEFFTNAWNFANSFTVEIVTVLATANEVFIDRALIVKYPAP
jgi:hypothetical protein